MKIEKLLDDEIVAELEVLDDIDVGTEKYEIGVNGVSKLVDKRIEIERLKIERENQEKERELKLKQLDDEKRDRKIKNGIAIGTTAANLIMLGWGTLKTLKFEETGTITTQMGRGFLNSFFKLRK